MGTQTERTMKVKCRWCKATTWIIASANGEGVPPEWKVIPMGDYLDEFECGNHNASEG